MDNGQINGQKDVQLDGEVRKLDRQMGSYIDGKIDSG